MVSRMPMSCSRVSSVNGLFIAGKPVLSVIFAIPQQQFYPFLAVISAETSKYPPTNVFWEVNGVPATNLSNCGFESHQRMTDRSESKYSNILTINESHGCTYDGTYSVSVNTNGEDNVSTSFNICKWIVTWIIHFCQLTICDYNYSKSLFSC